MSAALLAAVVATSVAACGSSSSSSQGGSSSTATSTSAAATTQRSSSAAGTHSSTATAQNSTTGAHSSTTSAHSSSSSTQASSQEGLKVFASAGCGSCHTLAAAHSTGDVGPNLDDLKPPEAEVVSQVTNGGGAMPSYSGKLSTAQIEAVAKFVASAAK